MKYTNKQNLPQALFDAITNDPYSKGDSDFSVTELLKPPRLRALEKKHAHEIEEDASDRLWSFLGQISHVVIERANRKDLAEKRLFTNIDGYKVSGQIDTLDLDNGTLSDFKVTTSYGFMKGRDPKVEWVAQLNMQAYLLTIHGHAVRKLQIIGLLRDWQIREAKKSLRYPQAPVAIHNIPAWDMSDTESFIKARIKLHVDALDNLPECSDEDTWGGKRCESYCAAKNHCDQFKNNKTSGEK